uniref:Uncharacterized protein n=1 Tax=Anopheles epiroticus TaxID=199890 RepID=A0A182PL63_9DIPT
MVPLTFCASPSGCSSPAGAPPSVHRSNSCRLRANTSSSSFGFISLTYRPTNVDAKASILASRSFGATVTVSALPVSVVAVALLTISTGNGPSPDAPAAGEHSSLSESPPLPEDDDMLPAPDAAALVVAIFVFSNTVLAFRFFGFVLEQLRLQVANRFLQHLDVQNLHLEFAVMRSLCLGSVRSASIRVDSMILQGKEQ